MLGFEAEGVVFLVVFAAFAELDEVAAEEIAGVELQSRLVGEDFHHASALGLDEARGEGKFAGLVVEDEVVVVTEISFKRK